MYISRILGIFLDVDVLHFQDSKRLSLTGDNTFVLCDTPIFYLIYFPFKLRESIFDSIHFMS